MAYYPNNTVPIATTGPHANRTQELPARAQRTNQVQYVEERLRNGLSPLAVAGVAALLTQLDSMQTLPGVSVSLVTEVAGYRRTLTCQNNAWDGHDLTHQFLDEHLYPSQCAIKKRTPPTETEQKEINRTTIPAQVTRSLRPRDADMSEQAWEQRAREQLPMTTNDYMAPLQHNITEQFPARYVLREGETWEANARYARNLRSLKPLLKAALQRARYCIAVDSTCRSDLPIDNLMPDVLVLTMPPSRFAEVAEMVGAIYDPNLRGSQKEPPPQRVIFANLLDHMACEGLLHDLAAIMSNVR